MAWILPIVLAAVAGVGCSGPEPRPDPTPEEWERAVHEGASEQVSNRRMRPLALRALSAPKLVSPADGVVISTRQLAELQGVLVFSWTESAPDVKYRIEIATEPNFSKVLYRKTLGRNLLAYRMRESGQFFWRVSIEDGSGSPGNASSNVQRFVVAAEP